MDLREIEHRLREKLDVTESEVAEQIISSDPTIQQTALTALIRTHIRQVLKHTASLAKLQNFSEKNTISIFEKLLPLSDSDISLIEIFKWLGIQAASAGQFELSLRYLNDAIQKAWSIGQQRDALSRTAMKYLLDIDIDTTLQNLSRTFRRSVVSAPPGPIKITLLVSAMIDENSPSIVTLKIAEELRDRGFIVDIVGTGFVNSTGSVISRETIAKGFDFYETHETTYLARGNDLINRFKNQPVHLVAYMITTMDYLGKVLGCVGLAESQIWINVSHEPFVGRYDLILQTVSIEQEVKTAWPGKSRFIGSAAMFEREILNSHSFPRSELGLPENSLAFGTFGRIEKCISDEYLQAITHILQKIPNAYLVLAGPGFKDHIELIQNTLIAGGVGDRFRYLGQRQKDVPRLLKALDIYCEPYPWPGGQSLMEAMIAALPVVAMRRKVDCNLDPTGCAPTTAVAEEFIGNVVPLANASDVAGYVDIALSFAQNKQYRIEKGALLRERILKIASMSGFITNIENVFKEVVYNNSLVHLNGE